MFAATKSFFAKTPPSGGGPTPAWSINWSTGTPSGYTLIRASSGTYVDSSGYIASASTDVARLTHDSSGTRLGLLVEESRTNLMNYSEDLSNAYWTKAQATVISNATTAPDGTTTADEVVEDSSNNSHSVNSAVTISSGTTYTVTVYAKANTRSVVWIGGMGSIGAGKLAQFDLSNGTDVSVGTGFTTSIESVGNGWYRCRMTYAASAATSPGFGILDQVVTTTTISYTGNGTSGAYFWGVQVEQASTATSYIPATSNSSVTRSADLAHVLDSSITSWGDPGALVVHFYPPGQAGTLLSTDDASAEQLGLQASSTTAARAFWSNGQTSTGTIAAGVNKAVHYWSGTASSFCINGGTVQTGTNNITTFGNIDFVTFGAEATDSSGSPGTFSQWPNLVIRKIEFYAGTLSSSDLQTITT
jgi:hypothetical protein